MDIRKEQFIPSNLVLLWLDDLNRRNLFEDDFTMDDVLEKLSHIEQKGSIFVLYEDNIAKAFISGYFLDKFFFNQKGVFTPEYGAYLSENIKYSVALFKVLYENMKQDGYTHHVICNLIPSKDSFLQDFSYASVVKDGLRKVDGILKSKISLEEIKENNKQLFFPLYKEHINYMSDSPIFLGERYKKEDAISELEDESLMLLYAKDSKGVVGFTTLSKTKRAGSELLNRDTSLAIKGTHISQLMQNKGYGKELVKAIHNYAHENGFKYVVTDFESYNALANQFWPKHFDIVMNSYVRYIGA